MRTLLVTTGCTLGLLATLSCGKPPPTVDPEPQSQSQSEPVAEGPRPGEVDHQYVGHTEPDDDASADDGPATDTGDDTSDPDAVPEGLTTEKLHALAEAAFDEALDPYAARIVTPALPTEWPPTSGKVVMLAYPLTPAPTGVVKYNCGQATVQVTVTVADSTVETTMLPGKGKKLGMIEEPRMRTDDPIYAAEQALIDVVAGKRTARKAHYLLERYGKWLDVHGKVGEDVDKRAPEFVKFARDPL